MINRDSKHAWVIVFIGILLSGIGIAGFVGWFMSNVTDEEEKGHYGLFSWDEGALEKDEWDVLVDCVKRADVGVVYQDMQKQSVEDATVAPFVKMLHHENVDVYALVGEPEWAFEKDGKRLVKWIRKVATYNVSQGLETRIRGITVDVEPYLLEEWDDEEEREELIEDYLQCIKAGYDYAKAHSLTYLVCIPNFYDSTDPDMLRELIAECCDGVAVMNYNRRDEYGQIEEEVLLAREYGKTLINIYELQETGKHGLDEMNTYAEEGLDALWKSAKDLQKRIGYDGLSFAYHYYKPLKKMLNRQ